MVYSDLPDEKGTYTLVFRFEETAYIRAGRLGELGLPPGMHVYVGSAHGPGGLRARVARHLRMEKPQHWHVDALTALVTPVDVIWEVGEQPLECAWVHRLLAVPGAFVPVRGFGSSDCSQRCPAHLVCLPDTSDSAALRSILLDGLLRRD